MGKVVAIRVGRNLQEDVHVVQDGGEGRVISIICHNLVAKAKETLSMKTLTFRCSGNHRVKNEATFLANHSPLA